ncbi:MAG: type II toxin-antitoxin system VapC family toxin [Deltaproteobacteria bacterium]|nr:type II toxin-antitoxin system VapC family toxin [Deltaproteobacteria bacterium]
MKILLDTHIWLWYVSTSPNMPASLRNTLDHHTEDLWLSPISIWETIILIQKGKFGVNTDPVRWVRRCLEQAPLHEAPLNTEVAIKSREVDLPHQDPADRFLAATSLVYDIPLATMDMNLLKANWLQTLS